MLAAPAMAVPNFRMPTDARIDLVRDLPNDATFEHDGQYYDLGYLYSTERVNGADVARTGQGFVLYHDDRYIKLDAGELSAVSMELGEDPTRGYVPPVATAPSGGNVARDGNGNPVAGQPLPYRSSTRRGSSGVGIVVAIVVFVFLAMLRFMMRSAVRAMLSPMLGRRPRQPLAIATADPFESRVSARLAELENQTVAAAPGLVPAPSPVRQSQPTPAAAAPVARGFGRRGL